MQYRFPKGLRIANLAERKEFYRKEFDLQKVRAWLSWRDILSTAFAVIVGRKTNVYPKEFESVKDKALVIDEHSGLHDVLEYILYYLPEGVYYDRNVYRDLRLCKNCQENCWKCKNFLGQELAFDLDPENVDCPYHGSLEERVARKDTISFCMVEFKRVRKNTVRLYKELSKDFEKLRIVFSGRGFHVHVLDESAMKLSKKEREEIAKRFEGFGIDEWITNGEMRLIRLPYSLNALVSRICVPISFEELKSFDPRKFAKPAFLK